MDNNSKSLLMSEFRWFESHESPLRTALCKELGEYKLGTVITCHCGNKSVCEISSLVDIPRSTVLGVIAKWKH